MIFVSVTQFNVYLLWVGLMTIQQSTACPAICSTLNVKALVGTFKQEKALVQNFKKTSNSNFAKVSFQL